MFGTLPTDIIIEILVRLPVKSLPRLALVCKLCYSRMSSPDFITAFSSRWFGQRGTSQFLLLSKKFGYGNKKCVLLRDDNKFKENSIELALPIKSKHGFFCFIGCCDGLICFQDICDCIICIWNPCIRKAVSFTFPSKPTYQYTFGFGFISEKNIYKVVRILYLINHREAPPAAEVEVYEQGEGKWREIGYAPPRYITVQIMPSQVFLHGAVHWLAYDWRIEESRNSIVVFEMVDEVFRDIALAPLTASHLPDLLSVSLLKDLLAVLCRTENGKCSLWVMRDYGVFGSWTNLYNVSSMGVSRNTLGIRKNGELLFVTNLGTVASYDHETKTITNTSIWGRPSSLIVLNLTESLRLVL